MKMIHCADLHLDSKMTGNLSAEQAKERRNEILATFQEMVRYAIKHGISVILIAGDLYDKKNISAAARNIITSVIREYQQISFFYLKGNHDADTVLKSFEGQPKNLYLFSSEYWRKYKLGDTSVVLTGLEITEENNSYIFDSLVLDPKAFNIVTLHGQLVDHHIHEISSKKGSEGIISLKDLQNKGIDYLALGHIHARSQGRIDARGSWAYPGCLEGRGFDECGEHGFLVLDIDEKRHEMTSEFVPIAYRKLHEVEADVTGCRDSHEALRRVEATLKKQSYSEKDLIKVILTGQVDVDCEFQLDYMEKQLEGRYYFLKIKNKTKIYVDYEAFALDASLKGEFVRRVQSDDSLNEEQKAAVIQHGIKLLMGEIDYAD